MGGNVRYTERIYYGWIHDDSEASSQLYIKTQFKAPRAPDYLGPREMCCDLQKVMKAVPPVPTYRAILCCPSSVGNHSSHCFSLELSKHQTVNSDIEQSRLVHLDVEDCSEELLRQLSFAIKNQLGHSKPPTRGILLAPRWFFMS